MTDSNHFSTKAHLTTHSLSPDNQETPISFLQTDTVTDRLFYRRNHHPYPQIFANHFIIPITGLVQSPLQLSMQEMLQLPSRTVECVLECAGNKRQFFSPKVFGEQWGKGAISQGVWKGVTLGTVLELAGIDKHANEIVFEGYDFGKRTDLDQDYTFARSLPMEKALHPDTLIAYEYNHQPIPFKHGFPLRLIVPQWYGMASVKWLKGITVIDGTFYGPFQTIDYIYYPDKENNKGAFPVTTLNVNSTIQKPVNRDVLNTGKHQLTGIAWTGEGKVSKVEISLDNGTTWEDASLKYSDMKAYGWVSWTYTKDFREKGEYTILSRATDTYGRVQPLEPFWNRKGYGYNAIDCIVIKVE